MRKKKHKLDLRESSDFQCLLELMVPLYREPAFAWLPELFSIIGYEDLIVLSKFAGGSIIKIPTLQELTESIEALEWYYKVFVTKKYRVSEIPQHYHQLVYKIAEVYDARNREKLHP